MKKLPIPFSILVVFIISGCGVDTKQCTKEAKICEDGTVLSRGGINCEFPVCPEVDSIQEELEEILETESDSIIITLLNYPSTATSGKEVVVQWSVEAPVDAQFIHTAIYYDSVSHTGIYGLDISPVSSGYSDFTKEYAIGKFDTRTFETILIVTEKIYFRAHAIVNGNHYWTDEKVMMVEEVIPPIIVKEFDMIAKKWTFEPETITVNEGDNIILHITSIDVTHGFGLSAFGINEDLREGETVDIEFVANKKGTFNFRCIVSCGSGHSGMKGQLIVE